MLYDLVIIGGGIIGLSTAMEALRRFRGKRVIVLEKEKALAQHQTGHNSGVIHSGTYYMPGSLKAKLCVAGAAEMIQFCREHGIPHEICGKVIVATSNAELPKLEELHRRGQANGVPGLQRIGPERLRELEPHARGVAGLHVPGTGITDYTRVTEKYAEIVRGCGGGVLTSARMTGIKRRGREVTLNSTAGDFQARYVINCAGLHSDRIAHLVGADSGVRITPFRGEYYELVPERAGLVRGLIYPVPDPALPFLGVHFTKRVNGEIEAGPNAVLALRREGYRRTDASVRDIAEMFTWPGFWRMARKYWRSEVGELYRSCNKAAFTRALQKLIPEIQERDLRAGGAGVRAQALDRNGKLLDDFCFVHRENMVHVINVPSPAATASLPIGRAIVDMAAEAFSLVS